MITELIRNALEYYDMNNEKYNEVTNKIKYGKVDIKKDKNVDRMKMIFYDNNKKEIFRSEIET